MDKELLLKLKIKKLEKLIKLNEFLIEAIEEEAMESIPSVMKKKLLVINEIRKIDEKLKGKEKDFSEQKQDNFRYIKKVLQKLKKQEEKLLYMAQHKKSRIESNLAEIEKVLRIKNKYKLIKPKKNIFEEIG